MLPTTFFCVTKFLTQDNPKHYGGLKKAQITPQLKLSPCKPNLRCRNTIVQSRRTDPKGSTSHNIDASPEGFSEGFPVDDVIRFGASPSARGWRKGQWRKGRWGGAGAGQMAPSVGLAQRPTFCQPGWVAPRAASFPLFGCCPVSRPAGRLGLEMACLRPAIVAVAGKSTFCELRANCSDWLFATCIAREVPEVPAGGSQNCGGSPSSISSGCCCCCSRMNLSTRCMTGKNFRLILLAAYFSASLFRCAADFRPRRREVAARLPVTGALDRPLLVLPFLGCTCTFSAVGVEPTVNVTPANVAVWRPFLRPALSTATSPCFATESVASMASKCSWSERAATSEGAPAMGKRPNMETFFAVA